MIKKPHSKLDKNSKDIQRAKMPIKKSEKSKKNYRYVVLALLLIFVTTLILIIFWLTRGKTTTTGRFPDNIKNESLECNISNLSYEKIGKVPTSNTDTKITIVFYGTEKFNSINLRHTIHLASPEVAGETEAVAHVQFAENLGYSGLNYLEFDNKFTRIDNNLMLSLYNTKPFTKDTMYEYFLIDKNNNGQYPTSLEEYRKNYESQGFTCQSSIN